MHSPDDSEPYVHYNSFVDSIAPQDNSQPSFLNNSGSTTGAAASLQQGHVEKNTYEFHPAFTQAVENVYNRTMSNDPQKYFGNAPQNQDTSWSNGIQAGNNALQLGHAGAQDWLGHVRNNLDDQSSLYKYMAQDQTVPDYVKNQMANDLTRKIDETDQLAQNFGKFGKALKYSPAVDLAVNVHDKGVGEGAAITAGSALGGWALPAAASTVISGGEAAIPALLMAALKIGGSTAMGAAVEKIWENYNKNRNYQSFNFPTNQIGGGSLFPGVYPDISKKNKKY